MPAKSKAAAPKDSSANLGFEAKLWLTADNLRNNMDAAEPREARQTVPSTARRVSRANQYEHVVPGLIFLKYISDTIEEHRAKLLAGSTRAARVGSGAPADPFDAYAGANPEDPDEYSAENVFWVPPAGRWKFLRDSAKQPAIGKIVDDAMVAIERHANSHVNAQVNCIQDMETARLGLIERKEGAGMGGKKKDKGKAQHQITWHMAFTEGSASGSLPIRKCFSSRSSHSCFL